MWARGLKHHEEGVRDYWLKVAPRVGAWIETSKARDIDPQNESRPVWARGLKLNAHPPHIEDVIVSRPVWARGLKRTAERLHPRHRHVAPRVGAWIETLFALFGLHDLRVAPRVGAWIETDGCWFASKG